MRHPRNCVLSTILLALTGILRAQDHSVPKVDVAITYDAFHTNHISSQAFWMQGGAIELGARVYRGFGIAARVEGLHEGAQPVSLSVPLDLVTVTLGPRYTWDFQDHRFVVFGEGLVGESEGFHSIFSEGSGPIGAPNVGVADSAHTLAADVGGGVDIRFTRSFSIRAIRASYVRTHFPNTTTQVQNSLSLGSGLVVNFGR